MRTVPTTMNPLHQGNGGNAGMDELPSEMKLDEERYVTSNVADYEEPVPRNPAYAELNANATLDAENYVVSPPPTTASAYARPGELALHDYEYDEHSRTTLA